MNFYTKTKRRGATLAGIFCAGAMSVLLLCGAGLTPAGNIMTTDVNAAGHSLTNAATVSATNVVVTGSLTVPANFAVPYTNVTGAPTRVGQFTNDANFLAASGNGSSLTSLHSYVTESISAATTETITNAGRVDDDYITLGVGSGAYTVNKVLSPTGAQAGDLKEIPVSYPASTNPTLNIYDTSTSGSLLLSVASTATAGTTTYQFGFDGAHWNLFPKGAVLQKNLGTGVYSALQAAANGANGTVVSGPGGFDGFGYPQIGAIPAGSVVAIIGDSIEAGYTGSGSPTTYPGLTLSAQPAFAGIAVYVFAIGGTTAGPTSGTTNSGLAIMSGGAYGYTRFLNGAQTATGTATVASMYSLLSGSGNLYFIAHYGANDISGVNSATFANYKTAMTSIWTTAHGLGAKAKVVATTIMDQSTFSVTKSTTINWNKWLRGQTTAVQGSGAGFADYLCDLNAFFTDATVGTSTGDFWSNDGLHPTPIGSHMVGYLLSDAIARGITLPATLGQTSQPVGAGLGANIFTGTQTITSGSGYLFSLTNTASATNSEGIFNMICANTPSGNLGGVTQLVVGSGANNTYQSYIVNQGANSASSYFEFGMGTSPSTHIKVFATGEMDVNGNLNVDVAGKGLGVKEGSNAKQGTATLSAGTVTVSNTSITANSRIQITSGALNSSTALGVLHVASQTAGTGFTVTSYVPGGTTTQAGDLSGFTYEIFEPAP